MIGRKRSYIPLNVFLNGRLVGQFSREASGAAYFIYHQSWLEWEHRLPVSLSLPLQEDRYTGARVLAVFENLLPDVEPIRRRVAERVGADGIDAFSLLSRIGRDCVGALQFLPDGEEPSPLDHIDGEHLEEAEIAALLRNLNFAPLGLREERDFRISVAGAQEKTALLFHEGRWLEPRGTTPTTHILKPEIEKLANGMPFEHSVENEFFCLRLLGAFGLPVAHCEIASFEERKALVVERFDRRWAKDGRLLRLPQEDCCQALSVPPTRKYQNEGGPGIVDIMGLLQASDDPERDRELFFMANVIFWLVAATDGHAKNFSLMLSPGGRFVMSPLYDVMTIQPLLDHRIVEIKDAKIAMRVGNSNHYKIRDIYGRHFVETGQASGFSRETACRIIDSVAASVKSAINSTVEALPDGFPEQIAESVTAGVCSRIKQLKVVD